MEIKNFNALSQEDPEKTSFTEVSPNIAQVEGLTQRRREYVLSCNPPKEKYAKIMRRALIRFRGFRLWNMMLEEIRTYGTGSVLFDANNTYKANLREIMHDKVLMIEKYQDVKVTVSSNWLFHPDSRMHLAWSVVILVFIFYTFTLMPWIMAFEDVEIGNSWFAIETTADVVFFTDIILTLNTRYFNEEGILVNSRWKIFFRYLKSTLILDLLTVFPFYLIYGSPSRSSPNFFIRLIRISRIIRVLRASKVGKILKILAETNTFSFLNTHQGITRLFGGLFVVLLMAHFTACIWFFSAKIDDFTVDTWVFRYNKLDEEKSTLYLCSLYYICTVLTTVGFGDILPYTQIEKLITIMWMICGIGCYSFVVGNLSSVLSSLDQKQAFINEKLKLIQIFAHETQLPQEITLKIGNKVKKALDTTSLNDEERVSLVHKLSKNLRNQMATEMYGNAIRNISFFNTKDQTFVADIVPMLNYRIVKKKKLVYEKHHYADEMYFIKTGRICFIYGKKNMIFKIMIQGSYFGEIEIIENCPREFTVAAEVDSELLVMSKNLFEFMMEKYPIVAVGIKKLAIERKKRILFCKKELVDVLEKVEVRKETTFKDLAGKDKIKKSATQQRTLNEQIYLGENIQDTVRWIFGKIDEYERILMSPSFKRHVAETLRKPRNSLPPLSRENLKFY